MIDRLKRLKPRFLRRRGGLSGDTAIPPGSARKTPQPLHPPAPVANNAILSSTPQITPRSAWGNFWEGAKTILRLIKESADAFPPLKSTAAGLIGLIDLIEVCMFAVTFRH